MPGAGRKIGVFFFPKTKTSPPFFYRRHVSFCHAEEGFGPTKHPSSMQTLARVATKAALRFLDGLTAWLPSVRKEPDHLKTGRRGEEEAYFYLRKHGYLIVAKNWRGGGKGELDLVGWEGKTLCFIEVKTRGARGEIPASAAVDMKKRDELVATARFYRRRVAPETPHRFDVVSVYLGKNVEFELIRGAFEAR
jgi:putative endonuclease